MKRVIKIIVFFCLTINSLSQINDVQYPLNSDKIITALNFKDTDLRDIVRSIAFEYQVNIFIDNDVNKKVSTALFNIKIIDALKVLAEDNNLIFKFDSNRFIIKNQIQKVESLEIIENDPIIHYSNDRLSIQAENVNIVNFVNVLKNKTNKNYLLVPGTSGRVTGSLSNVDLLLGIKNILLNNGFLLNEQDSIFYISRTSYFSGNEADKNQTRYKNYWVSAKNRRVTIDVNQVSLDKVISDIAFQMRMQLVKLVPLNSNVTVKFDDLPIDQALNLLLYGSEYTFRVEGKVYILGNKSNKSLDNTRLIKLQYLRADKLKEKLPVNLTQSLAINNSIEHNGLIVTGAIENITSLEDYIKIIDKPVPQVLIEALVVDYNLDNNLQYGIKAARGDSSGILKIDKFFPGLDVTVSGSRINKFLNDLGTVNVFGKDMDMAKLGKLPSDFYVNLKALEQAGLANVRSKPLLATLNGYTASLKIGTVQNYVFNEIMPIQNQYSSSFIERERIEKIEASMSFEITPWIGPNNELTLEIKPEFQTPVGEFNPDKKNIPAINSRTFSSTVRLIDGETIVLGGLIQESEIKSEEKVPLLGDIPIIGQFFKSTTKRKSKGELIIYLTPKIYYGNEYENNVN